MCVQCVVYVARRAQLGPLCALGPASPGTMFHTVPDTSSYVKVRQPPAAQIGHIGEQTAVLFLGLFHFFFFPEQ